MRLFYEPGAVRTKEWQSRADEAVARGCNELGEGAKQCKHCLRWHQMLPGFYPNEANGTTATHVIPLWLIVPLGSEAEDRLGQLEAKLPHGVPHHGLSSRWHLKGPKGDRHRKRNPNCNPRFPSELHAEYCNLYMPLQLGQFSDFTELGESSTMKAIQEGTGLPTVLVNEVYWEVWNDIDISSILNAKLGEYHTEQRARFQHLWDECKY